MSNSISVTFQELCSVDGLSRDVLIDIIEHDIVRPAKGDDEDHWEFDTGTVQWIKKAVRLSRDFDIDWIAVALVIDLMQENENLQQQLQTYQRQLLRHIGS